jgi:hypothetical protein
MFITVGTNFVDSERRAGSCITSQAYRGYQLTQPLGGHKIEHRNVS